MNSPVGERLRQRIRAEIRAGRQKQKAEADAFRRAEIGALAEDGYALRRVWNEPDLTQIADQAILLRGSARPEADRAHAYRALQWAERHFSEPFPYHNGKYKQ